MPRAAPPARRSGRTGRAGRPPGGGSAGGGERGEPGDRDRNRDHDRERHAGERERERLRPQEREPVRRRQQRARDRAMPPLAADPDDRQDQDEQAAGIGREHVDQHRCPASGRRAGRPASQAGSRARPRRTPAPRTSASSTASAAPRAAERPHRSPSVSAKKASSSDRDSASSSVSATRCSAAISPTLLRRHAAGEQFPLRTRLHPDPLRPEQVGEPVAVAGSDARAGPSASPARSCREPLARSSPARDHHHVVDALGDLGEQVAGDQHRAAALRPRRGAGCASTGSRAGRARWRARRGRARRGSPEQRHRDREPLPHPHRVALDAPVGAVLEPDPVQHLGHPGPADADRR